MWPMCCKLPDRPVRHQSFHTTVRRGVKFAHFRLTQRSNQRQRSRAADLALGNALTAEVFPNLLRKVETLHQDKHVGCVILRAD